MLFAVCCSLVTGFLASKMWKIANEMLSQAKANDLDDKLGEAIPLYKSGTAILQEIIKDEDETSKEIGTKVIAEYLGRIWEIDELLLESTASGGGPIFKPGTVAKQISIKDGEQGKSYNSVFGEYLNDAVTEVQLDEPYLYKNHQISNLVRFCELLVLKCPFLEKIFITTKPLKDIKNQADQLTAFRNLTKSLLAASANRIQLEIKYSKTLHDRHITLNNGVVIKIGLGLDYFKPSSGKHSLGNYNLDLRPCRQCNVDILFW